MNYGTSLIGFTCLTLSALLCGCSKPESTSKSTPPQAPALINVVHGAVQSFVAGDQSFRVPTGITIDARRLTRSEGGKQVGYVEIAGTEQKNESLAVIVFRFPESWLTTEKAKLAGLEAEKKELMACAEKLQVQVNSGTPATNDHDSCRVQGVTANGRKGIAVVDDKVTHIGMLTYALR